MEAPQRRRKLKQKKKKKAAARTEKVVAQTDTRETALHVHQADANTAAANEKPVTTGCGAHSQKNDDEMTRRNYNRIQNKTPNNTVLTEMCDSDDMTVAGEERPGHRVLTDDVIGLYDYSSTSTLEVAVRPKRDMDADKLIDNVIENETVRPKCDMGAEEPIDNETTRGAVRPKSDMDAEESVENKNEYAASGGCR